MMSPAADPAAEAVIDAAAARLLTGLVGASNCAIVHLLGEGHAPCCVNAAAVRAVASLLTSTMISLCTPGHLLGEFEATVVVMRRQVEGKLGLAPPPGVTIQ